MGRTAPPVTPGTNPAASTADTDQTVEQLAQDALQAGALAAAAASDADAAKDSNAVIHAELAKRDAEIAELRAMVKSVARAQVSKEMPEQVELPELADVMKQKPEISVLTKQGWYVPAVHPTQRKLA